MSRTRQRRIAKNKALAGVPDVKCYEPDKITYTALWRARAAAQAQGLREYQCGDHYHLTSKPTNWKPRG